MWKHIIVLTSDSHALQLHKGDNTPKLFHMSTGYLSLTTKHKVSLARIISRTLHYCSIIIGKSDIITTRRRGDIQWQLDINQGIDLAIYLGMYEPHTSQILVNTAQIGDIIIDIGANLGAHTLPLAKKVGHSGRVIAVEPTTYAVRRLQTNIQLNPELSERIMVIPAMLGEHGQELPGSIPSSWPLKQKGKDLDSDYLGELQRTDLARSLTLDELVNELNLRKLSLIKLDVDGYEYGVLAGGEATIKNFRPKILIEMAPYLHDRQGYRFDGLLALIKSLSYSAYDLVTGNHVPLERSSFPKKSGKSVDILLKPSDC